MASSNNSPSFIAFNVIALFARIRALFTAADFAAIKT